jgi:flagellar biosynthesis GTPase FlhF
VRAPLQNGAYYLDINGNTRSISWPKDGCDLLPGYAIGGTFYVVNNGKLVGACSHQPKDEERGVLMVSRKTTLQGQVFGQVTFMQGEEAFKAYAQGLPEYGSQPSASFALLPPSKRGLVLLAREQDEQAEAAREQEAQDKQAEAAREQEAQAEAAREQEAQDKQAEAAREQEAQAEAAREQEAQQKLAEAAREQEAQQKLAEAAREQEAQEENARSRAVARAMLGGEDNEDDDSTPGNGTKHTPGKGKKRPRPRGRPKLGHTWDYDLGEYIKTSDTGEAAGASAAAPMAIG